MTPEPRTLSPTFRVIIGGVLFIGAAIFFVALHHPRADLSLADIKEIKDGWWLHQQMPTPKATPRAVATPTLKPIVIQSPPRAIPRPLPSICQVCLEREMRYRKAIETGMGADTTNVRQLPQFQPNPQPSPNIFAYSGYQQ